MELSVEQESAVRHGDNTSQAGDYIFTPQGISFITPSGMNIDVTIYDGGTKLDPEPSLYIQCCAPDHPALDTVGGYCEIYQRTDLVAWNPHIKNDSRSYGAAVPVLCSPLVWFYRKQTRGGAVESTGYPTKNAALAQLAHGIWGHIQFWESKVGWKNNGDMTIEPPQWRRAKSERVIRCGGIHYTIGPEPSSLHADRQMLGHSGAQFRFRMLTTGDIITSHNVWYQGCIPAEYRELLPDNAVSIRNKGE